MSDMHLVLQELFKVGRLERREITLVAAPRTFPIWDRVEKLLKIKGPEARTLTRHMLFDLYRLFPQLKGEIELTRYIYTLGTFKPARVPADGYLLARRSEVDGSDIAMFHAPAAQVQQAWADAFAPDAPGAYVSRFVAPARRDQLLAAYGVTDDGGSECFHELHPYVVAHRDHYLKTYGVDIGAAQEADDANA
ncbi:MAG: hypothetical protein JHC82_07145 [Stenotrophomonas sp.]|nr:hypothetical protein [Stenotrophomonas sp.]